MDDQDLVPDESKKCNAPFSSETATILAETLESRREVALKKDIKLLHPVLEMSAYHDNQLGWQPV